MSPVRVSSESLTVCRLSFWRNFRFGESAGPAFSTGFLWRRTNKVFLVTNWHCVTGINPDTGSYLGTFCPNFMVATIRISTPTDIGEGEIYSSVEEYRTELQNDDGQNVWIEHPSGRAVDLVAMELPYTEPTSKHVECLNDVELDFGVFPQVGDDAFIIGYPEGVQLDHRTPIWKRASIATEPGFDNLGQEVILVDCLGNSGLSGSPVLIQRPTILTDLVKGIAVGRRRNILGIYAGRLGNAGLQSQLGRVWKMSNLERILEQT